MNSELARFVPDGLKVKTYHSKTLLAIASTPMYKSIRTRADLATNGQPPAFEELVHVGRPGMGDRKLFEKYLDGVFERNWLTNNGPVVQELERRIAAHLGVRNCVAMCNGTIALEIAIRALGMEGEVIVPSYTFIATAHALHWQGITPVFADIDPLTHNIDPAAVRKMLTPKTTGIIGVHLWGRAAPVEALESIASEFGLHLIFDSAHAFACSHGGKMIGGFGRAEILSFHATKVFNTFEGGAVVTNDDALAAQMRLMRNFGFAGMDDVIHPGTNGKMVEVCAAMGLANLDSIGQLIAHNLENYTLYKGLLKSVPGVRLIDYDEGEKNNFQYIVIELSSEFSVGRDELLRTLHAENILARRYFWPGCHGMQPYRALYPHAGMLLPHTERVANRVIVLPNGSDLRPQDIHTIVDVIRCLSEHT